MELASGWENRNPSVCCILTNLQFGMFQECSKQKRSNLISGNLAKVCFRWPGQTSFLLKSKPGHFQASANAEGLSHFDHFDQSKVCSGDFKPPNRFSFHQKADGIAIGKSNRTHIKELNLAARNWHRYAGFSTASGALRVIPTGGLSG